MGAPFRHVFGPVPSRRLGLSLGLDLNPMKVCSEDCVFCQVGRTTTKTLERREWVPTEEVLAEFARWRAEGGKADYATLSGSGEPTLHSRFGDVLDAAKAAGFKTAVLSNGTMYWDAEVRREAAKADVAKATVSAWDEESFARMHRPAEGMTFARLVEGVKAFRAEFRGKLWVEVMLVEGVNDRPEQVRAVADVVSGLGADAVHLNTVTRPSLTSGGEEVHGVSAAWLHRVSGWFRPTGEVPGFHGRMTPVSQMDDDTLCGLIARHPLDVASLAAAGGEDEGAVLERVAPLAAAGRLRLVPVEGRMTVEPVVEAEG